MEEAIFVIGGKRYPAPPLNFKALKVVWPHVESVQNTDDMGAALDALPIIVSAALARSDNPLSIDEVENQMLVSEIEALSESVMELLIVSGVLKRGGETSGEATGEAAPPSTETGTDSSQNLLPLVVQVPIGTE